MKYSSEVKDKWGNTLAYKEYIEKTKKYSKDKFTLLSMEMDDILEEFASNMKNDLNPCSNETQLLVLKLQNHITNNYYNCTKEILLGLGNMYVCDNRFKNNIDKHGDGSADYIKNAITFYCK